MIIREGARVFIDPAYYAMSWFKALVETYGDLADFRMLWIFYMRHPRSPYRNIQLSKKSEIIIQDVFPSNLRDWNYEDDILTMYADDMYQKRVLLDTPLHRAAESYKEAIYNLSAIISNPKSTASDIKTASIELDSLPNKYAKMVRLAESEEMEFEEVKGKRVIRYREMLPEERKR